MWQSTGASIAHPAWHCKRPARSSKDRIMLNETTVARPIIPQWKRDGIGWRLLIGRRRFGRVIPDSKFPGMWRSPLSSGRLSDMANLAWAKNAVFEAACRELEFEQR